MTLRLSNVPPRQRIYAEWQNRPLEALYSLIFFDAIRDEGTVRNKAVDVALGCQTRR
jgi:transposase-like protein